MDQIATYPIYVDDDPNAALVNIRSKARRHQMRYGLHLLIVDYLQLIEVTDRLAGENQTQRITYISKSLKALARELRCPVIALSQLSRECDRRPDKRPVLSDLRDSGSIEQDGDRILMLYRESEYDELSEDPDRTDVYIRKNRHGPTGHVALRFDRKTMSFIPADTAPTAHGSHQRARLSL
jgi:replicative DNA helicase